MFSSCLFGCVRTSSCVWAAVAVSFFWVSPLLPADDKGKISGEELFRREWIPQDSRSHGGDGLGPQFNDTSCVGCHNQGGAGGAGPAEKNARVVSAFSAISHAQPNARSRRSRSGSAASAKAAAKKRDKDASPEQGGEASEDDELFGPQEEAQEPARPEAKRTKVTAEAKQERERLVNIHPGFRHANSIVLHRASTEGGYDDLQRQFTSSLAGFPGMGSSLPNGMPGMPGMPGMINRVMGGLNVFDETRLPFALLAARAQTTSRTASVQMNQFTFFIGERNTTSLFGTGTINSIPDDVLLVAETRKYNGYPEVSGRVARLADGRIGRFGWKAQEATLRDFVLTACATELGLNVPGREQAVVPQKPDYQPPGMDLTDAECDALVEFIAGLPAPRPRKIADQTEREYLKAGSHHFGQVGCSVCHTPHLGLAKNIYSDLLLHDMGGELSDSGTYAGFAPNTSPSESEASVPGLAFGAPHDDSTQETQPIGATRREWRTPPLWGVRDSAPYLHDGRAATLEQAIAMHGGEGLVSARKFFRLSEAERLQVVLFLKALVAADE